MQKLYIKMRLGYERLPLWGTVLMLIILTDKSLIRSIIPAILGTRLATIWDFIRGFPLNPLWYLAGPSFKNDHHFRKDQSLTNPLSDITKQGV